MAQYLYIPVVLLQCMTTLVHGLYASQILKPKEVGKPMSQKVRFLN